MNSKQSYSQPDSPVDRQARPTPIKRLRYRLIPPNSPQEHELWNTVKNWRARKWGSFLISLLRLLIRIILIPVIKVLRPRGVFAGSQYLQDNSRTILYTNRDDLLRDFQPRRPLPSIQNPSFSVSLITTLINERESITPWLESVAEQTRPPDEVIIVDGGSTDGTLEAMQDFARRSPYPLKILSQAGANIAQGRNLAISHAKHPVIACSDLGCHLHQDWLANLTAPFEVDPETQVVAGWYEAVKPTNMKMQLIGMPLEEVNPQLFLPSSRSIAYKKKVWEKVRGYPEWPTLTGEDSLFDLELKRACRNWAFVPDAVVDWHATNSIIGYWRKVRGWSVGDGETQFGAKFYWHSLLRLIFLGLFSLFVLMSGIWLTLGGWLPAWAAVLLVIVGIYISAWVVFSGRLHSPLDLYIETGAEFARVQGFLRGARQRPKALFQRYQHVKGFFFVLAGVPIDDTGGGARCTQLSLELLRQGFAVIYINKFPKYESVELDLTIYHPDLLTIPLTHFRWDAFHKSHHHLFQGRTLAALVEFPLKDFLPIIRGIDKVGGVVVYDLLDDWDSALGGSWFSAETEHEIITTSRVLIATEDSLAERLERLSKRQVSLLPNAVNHALFNPDRQYVRPADLPNAEWTAIYIGALWGPWFDWDLLVEVAQAFPEAALVVIGDYRGQCENPPGNLHFLGLKPQQVLPAYLAHTDVALIPWVVNNITQATSPLKVYEYLTMRKPVVAPNLRPLTGLPGVYTASDRQDFIEKVRTVCHMELPEEEITVFAANNNWEARVKKLLQLVEQTSRI